MLAELKVVAVTKTLLEQRRLMVHAVVASYQAKLAMSCASPATKSLDNLTPIAPQELSLPLKYLPWRSQLKPPQERIYREERKIV
ncbi:hypothetical protein A2U01_0014478 [Trifolium medium]|uniref:Uncharacterized protein n=1 Tax=Trifolium medium TaxID=97028 RepID=A0A392N152_9FABA|nr:hypothetical protein [Trifolium medium]